VLGCARQRGQALAHARRACGPMAAGASQRASTSACAPGGSPRPAPCPQALPQALGMQSPMAPPPKPGCRARTRATRSLTVAPAMVACLTWSCPVAAGQTQDKPEAPPRTLHPVRAPVRGWSHRRRGPRRAGAGACSRRGPVWRCRCWSPARWRPRGVPGASTAWWWPGGACRSCTPACDVSGHHAADVGTLFTSPSAPRLRSRRGSSASSVLQQRLEHGSRSAIPHHLSSLPVQAVPNRTVWSRASQVSVRCDSKCAAFCASLEQEAAQAHPKQLNSAPAGRINKGTAANIGASACCC